MISDYTYHLVFRVQTQPDADGRQESKGIYCNDFNCDNQEEAKRLACNFRARLLRRKDIDSGVVISGELQMQYTVIKKFPEIIKR